MSGTAEPRVEPGSYSFTFFSFPVCRISTKKCFRSCGASALKMLFKFSSVLYFPKYLTASGLRRYQYSFSCFQRPCCLWRYLFLLLYMLQSTLVLLLLSFLRLVWLNFCLPFSGPCSQDFLAFSLSRAREVFYAAPRICSSVQSKEKPPGHFEKELLFVFGSSKGDNGFENVSKWHGWKTSLQLLCWCETMSLNPVFNSQFHDEYVAPLTNQSARFYSIMRFISKLVCEVRRTGNCSCILIFAPFLKILAQIASMFHHCCVCSSLLSWFTDSKHFSRTMIYTLALHEYNMKMHCLSSIANRLLLLSVTLVTSMGRRRNFVARQLRIPNRQKERFMTQA